jgi:hypothetical protein
MGQFWKLKQFNLTNYPAGMRHLKLLKDGVADEISTWGKPISHYR